MERDVRREAKSTTRRGLLRKSVAQLAVLGLVAGGALFAFTATSSAGVEHQQPSCDEASADGGQWFGHVHVLKCGPDTAVAGTDITYTISSSRSGFAFGNLFTIDDTLPAGTTLVDASGDGWDCSGSSSSEALCTSETHVFWGNPSDLSVTVHIDSGYTGESIENCADLSLSFQLDLVRPEGTDQADASADTFSHTDESCFDTDITQVSDLSVLKEGPASVTVSAATPTTVSYDITVTNEGPSDSGPITVSDALPYGPSTPFKSFSSADPSWACSSDSTTVTCTADGLVAGASSTVTVVLGVDATLVNSPLENCAAVTGGDTSGITTNDSSCTALDPSINGGLIAVEAAAVVATLPTFTG